MISAIKCFQTSKTQRSEMKIRNLPALCCCYLQGWAHADKQEGMFNLKGIVNGSLDKKATSDFYLCWLLYDLSYHILLCTAGLTLKLAQSQDSALTLDNLSSIFHKPHFMSSYTRIIHVELEQKCNRDNLLPSDVLTGNQKKCTLQLPYAICN